MAMSMRVPGAVADSTPTVLSCSSVATSVRETVVRASFMGRSVKVRAAASWYAFVLAVPSPASMAEDAEPSSMAARRTGMILTPSPVVAISAFATSTSWPRASRTRVPAGPCQPARTRSADSGACLAFFVVLPMVGFPPVVEGQPRYGRKG
ncbi:hypothetical protein ACIGJO_35465 [Streptomyces sp. NPDC079020]|uniref:hypothetical protein n=1 Tax=Streptomyces sp. NPDC079020 TaxID=3365722 RepID=UPI0037D4F948